MTWPVTRPDEQVPATVAIAGRGSAAAAAAQTAARAAGWAVAALPGERATTVAAVLDAHAVAWRFPDYFGRNRDALDECMRELDDGAGPAPGYLTVVDTADRLLADEPAERVWLADAWEFYAEHYRGTGTGFAVLLLVAPDAVGAAAHRWRAAGATTLVLGGSE